MGCWLNCARGFDGGEVLRIAGHHPALKKAASGAFLRLSLHDWKEVLATQLLLLGFVFYFFSYSQLFYSYAGGYLAGVFFIISLALR